MIQITFLTLFLGLTSGPQAVELAVSGPAPAAGTVSPVSTIELLLDGTAVGRMAGPPWQARLDFGPDLLPHELVARALDAQGGELARTRQWVNLPRPAAEVEVALESGPDGRPRAAQLAWLTLTAGQATAVAVTLDGQPLPVAPDAQLAARRLTVPLPAVDLATAHVLSVEVRFAALSARRDLVFGGGGGEVSTELTAVPVKSRRGRLPPLPRLQGSLLAGGKALRIVAVEREPPQVTVVRDFAAREALKGLGSVGESRALSNPDSPLSSLGDNPSNLRYELALERDTRVRVLWPTARPVEDSGVAADLFEGTSAFTARDGGMLWLLRQVRHQAESGEGQRLADAAAVAGLHLLAGSGPRAVLLVLGPQTPDASRYKPEEVRRYLAALRVPLVVWSLDRPSAALTRAWGEAADVSSVHGLRAAVGRLRRQLDAQRVVWVEGLHLPQSITAAPGGAVEIAGDGAD